MSWGSLALCPTPPPPPHPSMYTCTYTGAHARTCTQNKPRGSRISSCFRTYQSSYWLEVMFRGRCSALVWLVLSALSPSRPPSSLWMLSALCACRTIPLLLLLLLLLSSSSSSPCSYIVSAGFSQSPGFAVKSWRKRRSAAESKPSSTPQKA